MKNKEHGWNMIIDWSVEKVKKEVDKITFAEGDPRMDGFTTWGCKQDLYEILWYVEEALKECGTYSNEDDYIKEHQTDEMWDILKGKKK
jgi:hypothetical protein